MSVAPRIRVALFVGLLTSWAGSAAAQTETIEYYATDAVGSVRVLFDVSGNVLGRMDYEPFGRELFNGLFPVTEHFAGQTVDGESGLAYFHARQYVARTGRFSRVDPIYAGLFAAQRWNRYTYAVNNPIALSDRAGLDPQRLKSSVNGCTSWMQRNSEEYRTACPAYIAASAPSYDTLLTWDNFVPPFLANRQGPSARWRGWRQRPRQQPTISGVQKDTPPVNDTGGMTVVLGVTGTAIAPTGVDLATGVLVGSTGCANGGIAGGGFGSLGFGVGADVSAGAFVGLFRSSVSAFRGVANNVNISIGVVGITLVVSPEGRLLGGTIGPSIGVSPLLGSGSVGGTGVGVLGKGMDVYGNCK